MNYNIHIENREGTRHHKWTVFVPNATGENDAVQKAKQLLKFSYAVEGEIVVKEVVALNGDSPQATHHHW